jgi:prenyltransferase beta subunit
MKVALAVLVAGAALAIGGLALARTPGQQALIDSTVRFLQESQRTDGGFAAPGTEPSQGTGAWVALALAASGINPQDQRRPCGVDAYTYLVDHFHEGLEEESAESGSLAPTTAFERELLVVDAAGTDPRDFGGYDLVAQILSRRREDGAFAHVPGGAGATNDTAFAVLALSPVHEPTVEAAIAAAREWLVGAEDEDGGWYYLGRSARSEVDLTGAALEALVAAGPPVGEAALAAYEEAKRRGLAWMHEAQRPDGGFPEFAGERESNVASTAWGVQAIWATGGNPETWTVGSPSREPLDYMESMQQLDGHIRWKASSDANGIWMTAYVTPAFAGQALPIPRVPRAGAPSPAACTDPGGGGGGKDEEGVIEGGGGDGAPAVSRPKAGSKGKTAGGGRRKHRSRRPAHDHSRSRRGANLDQAQGTERAEPERRDEADREAPTVSGDEATGALGLAAGNGPGAPGGPGSGAGPGGADGADQDNEPADRAGRGPGAPLPAEGTPAEAAATGAEEVDGILIGGSSASGGEGKLAFAAPGLRTKAGGEGDGTGPAIAIGVLTLLGALGGLGWERRRGSFA